MANSSRRKGLVGEREVAYILKAAGFDVRGLEARGDHLCAVPPSSSTTPRWLHVEVKRHERIQLPMWLRQAELDAPADTVPLVAFRQNLGEWYAALRLAALVSLLK